jgi:[acyl-carrier-protein] S-malonyltransferase
VKTAFLFPGQGAELLGMGGTLLEREGPVRKLLGRASRALGIDLAAAVAKGAPVLHRTDVGQAALTAVCIGLAQELISAGQRPDAVAGHSLGELAAFCIAGCLEPEEAVDCALARGRLMAEAARRSPGGMAAVRIREEDLPALLDGSELQIAAHNAPEEWVLTGDRAALAAVARRFAAVPLAVAGPWHSRAMSGAQDEWRDALRQLRWRPPAIPLVANATGRFVVGEDPSELLAGQLTLPVRWAATLRTLAEAGVSSFCVVGPGRVLRGLCRANLGVAARVVISDGTAARPGPP